MQGHLGEAPPSLHAFNTAEFTVTRTAIKRDCSLRPVNPTFKFWPSSWAQHYQKYHSVYIYQATCSHPANYEEIFCLNRKVRNLASRHKLTAVYLASTCPTKSSLEGEEEEEEEEEEAEITSLIPSGKLSLCIRPILYKVNLSYTHEEQWAALVQNLGTNSRSLPVQDSRFQFIICPRYDALVRGTDSSIINPNITTCLWRWEKTGAVTANTVNTTRLGGRAPCMCILSTLSCSILDRFQKLFFLSSI